MSAPHMRVACFEITSGLSSTSTSECNEIPDPPRGLVAQLPLVFTFGAASFGSVETNETNVRLHVEEPDRVAVD
jgi:hypothetical protein